MSHLSYSVKFQNLVEIFTRDAKRYLPVAQLLEMLMTGDSELSKEERETIALYVSNLNTCHFCVGLHQAILKGFHVDEKVIVADANSSTAESGAKMCAVLDFAHKLTRSPGEVCQADVDMVRNSGWSDQTVEDVIDIVSLFAFLNRLVDGFGIKGNTEGFEQTGGMVAQNGYGPVVQMIQNKAETA